MTAFKFKCIHVPPQTVEGVRYRNDPNNTHAIELEMTVHGIHSTETETAACDAATHDNGSYTGTITVEGFKDAAHTETADLSVAET